jgi:hypothetical protein
MSVLNTCFSSLSTINRVSYSQQYIYRTSWDRFRLAEIYNSNVSTQRGQGNKNLNYYQFPSTESQIEYRQGGLLFYQYVGYSTIVKKN